MQRMHAVPQSLTGARAANAAVSRKPAALRASTSNQVLQTKLRVGAASDPLEREADRVADAVVSDTAAPQPRVTAPAIQRKCAECEANEKTIWRKSADEEEDTIQAKAETGGATAQGAASAAAAVSSGGAPLPAQARAYFEPRFGQDFSAVRIHTHERARSAAAAINARAYTLGQDIAFAPGQFSPTTRDGRVLMAHELAHVVQQSDQAANATIRRSAVRNCEGSQGSAITAAASQAASDLGRALAMLNKRPASEQVKTALWLAFRDDSDATLNLVTRAIGILNAKIAKTDFACAPKDEPNCLQGDSGFVRGASVYCPENPGPEGRTAFDDQTVYLCTSTFGALNGSQQSGTVIHEIAHLVLNACDMGYFDNLCGETIEKTPPPGETSAPRGRLSGTRGDSTAERIRNADAFACFTRFLTHETGADLGTRMAGFRGDGVSIKAESNVIYTEANFDDTPLFTLDGVPENSGFMFRWHLEAGGRNLKVASPIAGRPWVFTHEVTRVTVSKRVRGILQDAKITSGKIVCEIQLFEVLPGEDHPAIVRKTFDVEMRTGAGIDARNIFPTS